MRPLNFAITTSMHRQRHPLGEGHRVQLLYPVRRIRRRRGEHELRHGTEVGNAPAAMGKRGTGAGACKAGAIAGDAKMRSGSLRIAWKVAGFCNSCLNWLD